MWQSALYELGNTPFTMYALSDIFPSTRHISDKARRLEKEGRIIRLKKGLYVRSVDDGAQPVAELIANHLYGPSYVSMQSALRHYGLIPERVYATMSMTIKHSRSFDTPLGRYDYLSCGVDYFPIGVSQHHENNMQFLIACPEKALCDLFVKTRGLNIDSVPNLLDYLENDLRFDLGSLKSFDIDILRQCHDNTSTRRNILALLIKLVENEQ
ncbi:MAG: hypothetical protein J5605_07990 [Bacteroidales bacterium]|nr:hypothetical protein [Bacteroidales bacterium]